MTEQNTDAGDAAAALLADQLRVAIAQGAYKPFSKLPAQRELASRHGCSRYVVRAAIEQLMREGIVRHVERSGAFVNGPADGAATPAVANEDALDCVTILQRPFDTTGALRRDLVNALLRGYTQAQDRSCVRTRFVFWEGRPESFSTLFAPGVSLKRQGCVLVDLIEPELMRWMDQQKMPHVVQFFTNYNMEGLPEHHSVFQDKVRGGYDAARHLVDLGHRRISYIGYVRPFPDERPLHEIHGFRTFMEWSGMDTDPKLFLHVTSEDARDAMPAIRELLSSPDRPTAVIAQTDGIALTTMEIARELGLAVPGQLSVVGFNDQAEAARATPPLTTLRIAAEGIAREALSIVLGVKQGRFSGTQKRPLACTLIVRGSTGPAPV